MDYEVIGYGSLLSHKSLKETIPNKHFTQVIVRGYKRVFNIADIKSENPDVLNVITSPKHFFNGVMFKVNEKELAKIKKRENVYKLRETFAYDFLTGKELCECFICVDLHFEIDKQNRKPNKSYFILCREAAYHISKIFGNFWDETTFTSDNKRITDWIKENKEYNTIDN